MITIKPGSHVHTLITVLALAGEFPMSSLGLLGSVRSYKDLIHKLTKEQTFRIPDTDERITCRLLTVSGKGKLKTIRFHKGGLVVLKQLNEVLYDRYLYEYDDHTFSGNSRHVERNHLVAEAAVMCMRAGIEARTLEVPDPLDDQVRQLRMPDPYFYFARDLKRVNEYELNKIRFTRLVGAIIYPGGCYAVYNSRGEALKWMGEGESKIKFHLQSIFTPLKSFEYPLREAAVMFGSDYSVALEILEDMKKNEGLDNGLFKTYQNIFFVPMNEFGVRLPRILTRWSWKERILSCLFRNGGRSYGRGSFTYDAYTDGVYQLSFLDGDIWRLFRFREAILDREGKYQVVCYQEQAEFVRAYFGDLVTLRVGQIATVEEWFEIDSESLL